MFLAYSLLLTAGVLLIAPFYIWRYRKTPFLRKSWRERLGFLPASFQQAESGAIWIHAVSVGETLAIAGLVEGIQKRYPGRKIFMSHVTPTGREAGEKRFPELAGRFYLPLDWRGPVRRALHDLCPELLLIVETELWPNLLREAHRSGAKVVVVNARLSRRSLRGYRTFRFFMRRVFENIDFIFAQSAEDAQRFVEAGAPSERIAAAGNIKFDVPPPPHRDFTGLMKDALAGASRTPVFVAASTMPGEEELVLEAWNAIQRRHPRALMILAPRHPARFDEVARILQSQSGGFIRRTALAGTEIERQLASPGILLLDTIGELASIFELADVVFMGGTLVATGGHNPIEPAQWSKPILFGPHMENFRDIARIFLDAHAALRVKNSRDLGQEVVKLMADSARRQALGETARRTVDRESGATRRTMDGISGLLETNPAVLAPGEEAKG
ncbi:MAG TPA: 3-deoxy-D-manno-octulosonic acid transferase [Terriglobia bacterium]|nr:3-deoxy-D-manno-octulosonic acid transferase [Terriglobia bacterium]